MFLDHVLQHEQETLICGHLPPHPPRRRHAQLEAQQDLLAGEGLIRECALGAVLAEVLCQERAALHIDAIEDVQAAQPLDNVAHDLADTVWTNTEGWTDDLIQPEQTKSRSGPI